MTINEAIARVMTTQYKKDMGEALEIVKTAGFQVVKYDGEWMVRNPKTNRTVVIKSKGYRAWIEYGSVRTLRKEINVNKLFETKFDFEGNLRKPLNRVWYYLENERWNDRSATKVKYENLDWKKKTLKWRRENVEKTKKKIEELQRALFREMQSVVEAEKDLEKIRKDLKLKN